MPIADPKTPRRDTSGLVAAYALRLHSAADDEQHVVSPLGAWLLLALAAPLTSGGNRERLETVLGCDAEVARRAADELLEVPPPALALAFASWHRGDIGPGLEAWSRALPPPATTGSIPTQTEANEWVRKQTMGQIESMPEIEEDVRLLLATTVATKVSWLNPFHPVPAAELGGPWASRVKRVMWRCQNGQVRVIAQTEAAGLVGVSHDRGDGGLDVVSVIAVPDMPRSRVIEAAYEVAASIAGLPSTAAFVRAFDLPLKGHAWVVRERMIENAYGPERIEKAEVTIPAWSSETMLPDLIATPGTGFAEIVHAILEQLPPDARGNRARAFQAANAKFDTNGFSAAALTATAALLYGGRGTPSPRRAIERTVEVRFDRPFAVVAATNGPSGGLPAFGAWVTEPMEPSELRVTEED